MDLVELEKAKKEIREKDAEIDRQSKDRRRVLQGL